MLFAALLFPAGFAGWAVGHYTSLGSNSTTVVHTISIGVSTSARDDDRAGHHAGHHDLRRDDDLLERGRR